MLPTPAPDRQGIQEPFSQTQIASGAQGRGGDLRQFPSQTSRDPHPFSLNLALCSAATLYQLRREVRAAQERAETAIRLATEQGFPFWIAIGSVLRGWALVQQGQPEEGIEQMQQSLTAHRATGAELDRPYLLALLADAYRTIGKAEAGLTALAEALTVADTTGERFYEPEQYRLKGALLVQQSSDNQAEAEICFHHAKWFIINAYKIS